MKILITGGAGYIGSATVQELLTRNYEIVVLDTLEFGTAQILKTLGVGNTLVVGSISDSKLLANIFTQHEIEAVIHFAAYKNGSESIKYPANYFLNNVGGTFILLNTMVQHGVKNLIFSSSGAIYGNPLKLPVSEDYQDYQPVSPYGESKLLIERALPWYDQAYGLKSSSLRFFNAAGASLTGQIGENWDYTNNLIPFALKAALGVTKSFSIFGTDYPTPDGTCIRDFIHVNDLAVAHILALESLRQTQTSTTYNLGTGEGTSVRQVVETVKQITGLDFGVKELPARQGDPIAIWADSRKAKIELDWHPIYNLTDMIRTAYEWHRTQLNNNQLNSYAVHH